MREITKTLTIPVDGKKTDFRLTKLKTRGRSSVCTVQAISGMNRHEQYERNVNKTPFGTLPFPAGCRAVTGPVPRALFIGVIQLQE